MTFDDDFVRLNLPEATINMPCKDIGVEWPPPDVLMVKVGSTIVAMTRSSHSQITDEQRRGMTNVCRGAEYRVDG